MHTWQLSETLAAALRINQHATNVALSWVMPTEYHMHMLAALGHIIHPGGQLKPLHWCLAVDPQRRIVRPKCIQI